MKRDVVQMRAITDLTNTVEGMNSRATQLKFMCPLRMFLALPQPVNIIFWSINKLNCLIVASELHVILLSGPTVHSL